MDLKDMIVFCKNDLPRTSFDIFEDMRKTGELCDLSIKVQNRTLTAHRVILAAGIPYFRSVFANCLLESEKKTGLEELDPRALESLINFAYTRRVNISLENVQSLLVASDALQMCAVKDACIKFLSERLLVSNVAQVYTLAQSLNDTELIANCNRYIRQNFEEFHKSHDFLNLSHQFFVEIISKNDLHVSDEETVFEAVMNWVKASPSERKIWLPELLSEVRLIFLPIGYLINRVASEEFISDSVDCKDLIEKVKTFHLLPKDESLFLNLKTQPRATRNRLYAICYSSDHGCSVYNCELRKGTWKKLTSKEDVKGCVCYFTATNEDMYLFFLKNIEKINLKTLVWQELEPTHDYILGSAVVSHGNMLYVFGSNALNFMDKIRCFNIRQETWLKENKMMVTSRCSPAVASLEQSIYITGGLDWTNRPGRSPLLSTVEKYSPSTGQSREIASMLISRYSHGCTSMNGKIYVCGGLQKVTFCNTAEVYDPVTDQWNCIDCMNNGRYNFSLISDKDKVYAVGGKLRFGWTANDLEIYDQETNSRKSGFSIPEGFQHAALVLTNSE